MIANRGNDDFSVALAHLSCALGLYWAVYSDGHERVRGVLPPVLPACVRPGACPLVEADGACRAAAEAPVGGSTGLALRACHAGSARQPSPEIMSALTHAFECHMRAAEDVEATVRELTVTYQELAIAYGIMETISLPSSREETAQALLSRVAAAAGADGACLLCLDKSRGVQPLAIQGMSDEEMEAIRRYLAPPAKRRPAGGGPFALPLQDRQVLVSALQHDDRWSGLMALARDAGRPFTSREAKLVQAAGHQAALALRNRSLVDDLRGMFINTIQALVTAIEIKDAYTCGHSRRVAQAARRTARLLGLPDPEAEAVYMSGIVHDIGKIGIERTVLCKTGRLTGEEWEAIRSHPEQGAGIINCIPQLRHLVGGVRYHHERGDGSGYPFGLRQEEIPLASRIIAVCDSYDAMTSERSYRPALSPDVAVAELRSCMDTKLSAPVVEAFVETLSDEVKAMAG